MSPANHTSRVGVVAIELGFRLGCVVVGDQMAFGEVYGSSVSAFGGGTALSWYTASLDDDEDPRVIRTTVG